MAGCERAVGGAKEVQQLVLVNNGLLGQRGFEKGIWVGKACGLLEIWNGCEGNARSG
jgi:hypothetical protein